MTTGPLWVSYRHAATNAPLKRPERQTGDTDYHITPAVIPGYTYVENSAKLTGQYTTYPQRVTLIYRPSDWLEVDHYATVIKLKDEMPVFSDARQSAAVVDAIPAGIYFKSDLRVVTDDSHFWYRIGDHHWLPYDTDRFDYDVTAPEGAPVNYFGQAPADTSAYWSATVDFVADATTDVFDHPYGLPVSSVADGEAVTVCATQTDPHGLTWHHLHDLGWLPAHYLTQD